VGRVRHCGDSSVAYVTESGKSYEIDPATGGITPVTFPDPKAALWAVTPTRLYGHARTWVDGAYVERLWIRDRWTGETTGPVDLVDDPRMRTLYPYGEGLAALHILEGADGGSGGCPFVRRVLVMLPATGGFSGAVRVVQVTDRPVQVDAIVVVR
jgi:hypothetical protein